MLNYSLAFVVALFFLNACSYQTNPPPTAAAITPKIARVETSLPTILAATETPKRTATPSRTSTRTVTTTRTATAASTATPTETPTLTLTPDPYAPQAFLGDTRGLARRSVLNLKSPPAGQISPALFSLNYWAPPFGTQARQELDPLNFVVLRYGGETFEEQETSFEQLDRFILDARAVNMEPLIQVPYTGSDPAFAAKMVRYVNVQKHYDVRFWSIGNEEDKNRRSGAKEKWINSWRSFRDAMKRVDPDILLFGPEYAQAYDLNAGGDDWLTPFLQVNGDIVDVVSLHRYPFNGGQANPTVLINNATNTAALVHRLRDHIKRITGRDIPLAFTEFNLSGNWREADEGSSASFSAGLWMAETLGQMAESGVVMANIWSARSKDSMGLIANPAEVKRPTYFAAQLYSNYGDRIVPLASHVQGVSAHAARNSRTGAVTIVLINRSRTDADFVLDFDSNQEPGQGVIYFDLSARKQVNFQLPWHSMASITLDSNMNVTRTFLFSRTMFNENQAPQVANSR